MWYSLAAMLVAAVLASAGMAQEARTTIGVLTCTLADGAKDKASRMMCGFKATASATDEKYEGTAQGLVQPIVGKQVLVWAVIGPAKAKYPPGFLAQRYARGKEVAGQPPSWIGAGNSEIVLQLESHGNTEFASKLKEVALKLSGTSAKVERLLAATGRGDVG